MHIVTNDVLLWLSSFNKLFEKTLMQNLFPVISDIVINK